MHGVRAHAPSKGACQVKFRIENTDTGSLNMLGGLVSEENAFFTMLTVAAEDQPPLADIPIDWYQVRYGATADSKVVAQKRTARRQRHMIYKAWRVE